MADPDESPEDTPTENVDDSVDTDNLTEEKEYINLEDVPNKPAPAEAKDADAKKTKHHVMKKVPHHGHQEKRAAEEDKPSHLTIHEHKSREAPSGNMWMFASIVLAILLVSSILTQGFRFGTKVDNAITDLNSLKSSASDSTKTAIESAVTQLESVKQKLAAEKPVVPIIGSVKPSTTGSTGSAGKAKVEFYVMSQCPYGTQVEDAVKPVLDKFAGSLDFSINFIANDNGDGTFTSLHGDNEVKGDIVQLCAAKYNPDKYMDMVVCQNQNAQAIPTNWEQCAKDEGLAVDKIKACYEGQEGKTLLSDSIKKATAANARGSPTMYFNGQLYSGGRDELSFTKAICQGLQGNPLCADMPECTASTDCTAQASKVGACNNGKCAYSDPKPVNVLVLNDKRCGSDCDVTQLMSQLKSIFKGMKVTEYDYSTADGKALFEKTGVGLLPAVLFDNTVQDGEGYASVQRYLVDAGDYKSLRIGAAYDPTAEICTNGADDNGDGLVDCKDPTCKDTAECMSFDKPTMDFFVMGFCPYGNQAEEAIKPVFDVLSADATFRPHYIYYPNYGGGGASYCMDAENKYCSMHGIQEAHQDIRERCVQEKYGIKGWFDFATATNTACTAQNADTCWENVAKGLSYDTAFIKSCQDTKSSEYAAGDADLMTKFGAQGSPAVFINGKEYTGARTPAGYQAALCEKFTGTKPAACSVTLSAPASAAAAPSTGGCGTG